MGDQKSSSEILNELFSTFNSSFPSSVPQEEKQSKKKSKKSKNKSSSSGGKKSSKRDLSPPSSDSSVDTRIKKCREEEDHGGSVSKKKKNKKNKKAVEVVPEKKKKHKSSKPAEKLLTSPGKKKKKLKINNKKGGSSGSEKIPIGDGFVVLNKKSEEATEAIEDGEIIDDEATGTSNSKRKKRKTVDEHENSFEGKAAKKPKKMSASLAYKLDAEEKLLLGYGDFPRNHKQVQQHRGSSSDSKKPSSSSRSRTPPHQQQQQQPSSSYGHGQRSRSRSPSSSTRHRVAPPRDKTSYKSSYLKFEKQRDSYETYERIAPPRNSIPQSSSSSYDTASYYDYHASRSRNSHSSSTRSGFGYVGKSYYYDDVEESRESRDSRDSRDDNNTRESSSRDSRDDFNNRESSSSSSSRDSRDRSRSSYGTSAWRHRHRSRSRSPPRRSYYHPDDIIDKSHLLDIARKNAKKLLQRGVMPCDIFSRDQILAIKAGGKSVDELTNYCRRLAKRDACGDARSDDDEEDDRESSFIHHPFHVKDKPLPTITLNIRNAVPLPVRTPQELAIESAKLRTVFPVSSGTQHRFKELEWKPVSEEDKDKEQQDTSKALVPLDAPTSTSSTATASASPPDNPPDSSSEDVSSTTGGGELKAIEAPPPTQAQPDSSTDTGITVDLPPLPNVDISSVIGLRLKAMRTLQENPTCHQAKVQLDEATKMMKTWADAKALEPKFLTVAELSSGPQAWAKRDQLRNTKQLDSGMGMHLLQKMGWRPGEGLGKNKEGQLEPLALDVKMDKKGLTAAVEELMYGKSKGGSGGPSMPVVYDLSGKHPVSALMELTAKRRWGAPEFEMCFEHGPPHKRQFVYKVIVNGVEYQPCVAVGNKKQAKANAAAFCLQSLGLLPTSTQPPPPSEMLQTVGENSTPPTPENSQEQQQSSSNSNPLHKTFSSSPSFLQTVKSDTNNTSSSISSSASALMPPPPPPPALMSLLNKRL